VTLANTRWRPVNAAAVALRTADRAWSIWQENTAYATQVQRIVDARVYVILQTLSWTSTLDDQPGTDDPAWPGILDGINAWILAQAGRNGVVLCNTVALDGSASGIAASMFVDGLHPKPDLMAKRSDIR